jgi:hypothetical protein
MRLLSVLLCVSVLFVQMVDAQERPGRPPSPIPTEFSQTARYQSNPPSNVFAAPDPSVKAEQSFLVQFTEFRFKYATDVSRTSSEIVQSFDQLNKEEKIELVQTVRLTVLEHHENMVQIGKNASIISGVSRTAQGLQQQSRQSVSVGTLVQVKATPQDGKVLLKVAYTASRMNDKEPEEKQSDIATVTYNSTLLLEIGKATLVGGVTSDTNNFLMVTISK